MVSSVDSEPLPAADSLVAEPPVPAGDSPAPRRRLVILGLPLATLVIGLLVTLALALVSQSQYTSNEQRLLKMRVSGASARRYAAYAEDPLPANRHSKLQSNSAFSGLDYAVYLGPKRNGQLLVSNVP